MVQGQISVKGGGLALLLFNFINLSRFIIFAFRNCLTLCKIILSCLKMNLCVCERKVGMLD